VGVEVYLVRQPGQLAEDEYHVASTLLLIAGLVLVGLVEAGSVLLSGWVQVEGFQQLLRVLIIALPFQLIATAPTAKLERLLDYRRVAVIELSGQVCYYVVAVPMAIGGCGAWSLVVGWLAQQIGTSVLFHRAARYLPRLRLDWAVVPRMLSYTLGFSMVTWTWQLRALVNPLVVGHFLGAEAVGQIGMAVRIVEALTFVKAIAWRLSAATLSRIQHDKQKLQEAVTLGMELQTLALAPVLLGFAWLGGLFLPQLFGERWSPALDVFPFIAVSYLTNAQFSMHSSVLAVFQRNYENWAFCFTHVILFAAGAAVCVPLTGLIGYGWGEMFALASYYVVHRFAIVVVGSISYRIAAVWWVGIVLGLFWRELGLWAMAMPFIALMWPESVRHLRTLYLMFRSTLWGVPAM
jgi:PST family polysaccharide transporter